MHLGEFIEGADPLSTEAIWQRCYRLGFFPADRVYGCALSAIDIALWDIKGKALGLPVYRLLGGPVRDKVVCYPHTQGIGREGLLDSCRRAVDAGWKFVRWHLPSAREAGTGEEDLLEPREAVPQTVDLFAALRDAVGDSIEICLDVHTRLDTAHTIDLATRLEPYRPFFLEDPLRSENPGSYRTLARHVRVPIAAGEQWTGKWAFREVIEEELVRYARIDLCIAGGITEAAKNRARVRDALHRHRSAQPVGASERRGWRRAMYGVDECWRAGDAACARDLRDRPLPASDRLGRGLCVLS